MALPNNLSAQESPVTSERFGASLAEAEVCRLQTIIRDQCGRDVALPKAWSRAIELLSLVEMLLDSPGTALPDGGTQGVRAPSLLTESRS